MLARWLLLLQLCYGLSSWLQTWWGKGDSWGSASSIPVQIKTFFVFSVAGGCLDHHKVSSPGTSMTGGSSGQSVPCLLWASDPGLNCPFLCGGYSLQPSPPQLHPCSSHLPAPTIEKKWSPLLEIPRTANHQTTPSPPPSFSPGSESKMLLHLLTATTVTRLQFSNFPFSEGDFRELCEK